MDRARAAHGLDKAKTAAILISVLNVLQKQT